MPEQTTTNEESKKCAECKKNIKRVRRYYRNGKYYCNPNCWKKAKAKLAEGAQKAPASK